jgi:nicotinamidase-related amidase
MMLISSEECQLIVLDVQEGALAALPEAGALLARAQLLARLARELHVPLFCTEQHPSLWGHLPQALQVLAPKPLTKMVFSACEEGLIEMLRPPAKNGPPQGNARSLPKHLQKKEAPPAPEKNQILLLGLEAHVGVLQTALDLLDDEFEVYVVVDATLSRRPSDKDAALDRLASAGAELVTTEMVVYEWLRSAEHGGFEDVHTWLKALD